MCVTLLIFGKPRRMDVFGKHLAGASTRRNFVHERPVMREPPEEIHNPQNSQLSIARFYGGCTFNGAHYVVVPVGSDGDWKLVRSDVLKARAKSARKITSPSQDKLL